MLMRLIVFLAFSALVFPQTGKLETILEAVPEEIAPSIRAVSYTHLTLPTILLV